MIKSNPLFARLNEESGLFIVYVKTLTGIYNSFVCSKSSTVDDLKLKVQELEGFPPEQQRFIYAGGQLEEGQKLVDYHIKNGHIIHLVIRLNK